jgi:hypothetical protein
MKKVFFSLIISLLFMVNSVCAAIKLPDGAVKGLPQNLLVLDEAGNSPQDGELYIYIEDMMPREVYTKDITLMNARDDAVYSIYMTAENNYTSGEVDLLAETTCKLWLDDELIYEGRVDGVGTPNMHTNGIDLGGKFDKGETRKLHAEFCWNITDATEDMINTYSSEDKDYYGEVSFKWIFYALISTGSPRNDGSGGGSSDKKDTVSDDTKDTEKSDDGGIGTVEIPNTPSDDGTNESGGKKGSGSGGSKGESDNPLDNTHGDMDKYHNDRDGDGIPDDEEDGDHNIEDNNPDDSVPHEITDGEKGGIIDKIVNKLPFVPKDVKTGYHSELVMYTKISLAAFGLAGLILIVLAYKGRKLKKLKNKNYE